MVRIFSNMFTSLLILVIVMCVNVAAQNKEVNPGIWVRPGYELSVALNSDVSPRHMAFGPDGTLYFTTEPNKYIMAARDKNKDGYYETVTQFYESENPCYAVLWYEGYLWYTETGAIYKLKDNDNDGKADKREAVLPEGSLPNGGGHHWRPLLINNGRLWTSLGDPGNITDGTETEREKIWTFTLDGKDKKLWCSGIRNTEKLVIRPGTDEIGSEGKSATAGESSRSPIIILPGK